MSIERPSHRHGAFALVRQFARRRSETEQCELCGRSLATEHQHLIEPPTRKLACVCDACAVLFSGSQQKYARVPRDVERLDDFRITDAQWDTLLIPIEMAFFFESSTAGRIVAIYPSPAGPTESLLPLETWQGVVEDNPVLRRMRPDVEALVANRMGPHRHEAGSDDRIAEYYILPIDECFKLVGVIRLHWKGLSGGTVVWREIATFFAEMRGRAERTQVASPFRRTEAPRA